MIMSPYLHLIKQISRGKNHTRDCDFATARALYHAMLTGKVPELALGALLLGFRIKGESEEELRGFFAAMQANTLSLMAPAGRVLPVVIPSYNGARKQANLTPLLALLLTILAFPVVVHGIRTDPTRVTSLDVFAALGIAPVTTKQDAQTRLNDGELVFMTDETLCPPVARPLALYLTFLSVIGG